MYSNNGFFKSHQFSKVNDQQKISGCRRKLLFLSLRSMQALAK